VNSFELPQIPPSIVQAFSIAAMSEETCFSQLQYLIKTKFEGEVEELVHLLKSGKGDEVLVNQLAEYLMVRSSN
jgi:hypothetical protein